MFNICRGFGQLKSKTDAFEPVEGAALGETKTQEIHEVKLSPQHRVTPENTTHVLLELVGALGLSFLQEDVDPFCIVKIDGKEVHRTKVIANDPSPIWTYKTKSLCLLKLAPAQGITIDLCHCNAAIGSLVGSYKVLGTIPIRYTKLLHGTGERAEIRLRDDNPVITLAIRFRKATRQDFMFFQNIPDVSGVLQAGGSSSLSSVTDYHNHASDIELRRVNYKSILKQNKKLVQHPTKTGTLQKLYRVWPFPDPENPNETTFMTKEQIFEEAQKPSKQWVEGGYGEYGTVFLEILGCDNLPNKVRFLNSAVQTS